MKNFVLVNIRDEKQIKKYQKSRSFHQSVILPYYNEGYVCFSSLETYSFEELITLFLNGDTDEEIGAISIIAKHYPGELYQIISEQSNLFSLKEIKFLFNYVVPSYLPIVLPPELLSSYVFEGENAKDVWVNILMQLRSLLSSEH